MVPNRAGQSPAPQWEILQDHGATDSSEVEDARNDVPPHRMAPKPALKRKESDRPMQMNSVKRPRVEQNVGSNSQPSTAGSSRQTGGGSAAGTTAAVSATRSTDSPDAAAELLQYAKTIPVASKPRRVTDQGRAFISAPVAGSTGGTSATQPSPARARPTQPQNHTQLPFRPRPRHSQTVPNSMKSASHAPPPTDVEIIAISSGDEKPAPAVRPLTMKKTKRLALNSASKKRSLKPESASAPLKVKTKSSPEVIVVLDSDEEEVVRKVGNAKGANGSASASASLSASTGATATTSVKGKTRVTEHSDASMASASDIPAPPPRPKTATNAKGKARAVSSDVDSDASMAYARASPPTSRPSSRTDVLPPPSSLSPRTPAPALTIARVSTMLPVPPSPATKVEPVTPQRRSSASNSAFATGSARLSRPEFTFASEATPISASTFAAATPSPSASLPESPRYTPIVKKSTQGIRARVGAGAGSSASIGSQQRHSQAGQSSQQGQKIQVAVKSTAFSRPPVSVSVPLPRKAGPKRMVVSDSESGSAEDSGSGSSSVSQSHPSSRPHNVLPGAGSLRLQSHSASRSAQMGSEAEPEPDTRGLSDALGLTHQQASISASHTDSDRSSRNNGKGKEKEVQIITAPLPGRKSTTHSRTASASSTAPHPVPATGKVTPSVSNANPAASTSSLVGPQAPRIPSASRGTGALMSTTAVSAPKPPHVYKFPQPPQLPKERQASTPGDSDGVLPAESDGLSSDAGYENVLRGSQLIVNKLAQLRKEKSAASIPVASSPPNATGPLKHPHPRVISPDEQEQPSTSPPPISPTPPLQASSTSTLLATAVPRPLLNEVRPQSAPSLVSPVAGSGGLARTGGHRVPLPSKHQRPLSISAIPQRLHTTAAAAQQRTSNPSSGIELRSPGNKPIWPPPPPSEPASPTDQGPFTGLEAPNVSGEVHMITDDETDAAPDIADEASEGDGGALIEADRSEEFEQSDDEELQEIEQVQQEVAEMSQSLAAASLSGPASVEDLEEDIPEVEDRGEGPSRRLTRSTRSSSASSGMHERMPPTPSSDENTNAFVETGSDGYANSADELAASASRPQGKTYGGFPVLTWKEFRKDLRNFTPECLYAADIPRALHDHINRMTPHTRLLPGMRAVYEAMIQENTAADEPDAPPVRIENPVDEEPTPAWEFYYTNKIYHGAGVPPPDIQTLRQREAYGNQIKMNFAYDKAGNLAHPGYPIYECNDLCGCGDECMNRVVQHGRKVGVAIRKTPNKGWGIFATQRIASGQFIGIYSGELLTDHEAHERGIKYNKWGKTYLFDIDFHHLKDPDDQNWTNKFTVDAYHCGNFTRFLNHSCDPNSRLYPCYINEGNIQKPLLAIFSRRVIEADEEVCFNYQGSYPGDDDDDEDEEPMTEREAKDRDLIYEKCMCGAKNCTGVMFK
ncbi:hypothetical protein D9619_010558 [Psilocybe cf. subviscida]|uniref:SET domain-containing protein n=1 Tax=Psilocybe cf. subviscida TaxID=2480587 RepID=A0A8H5ERY4_9AGAR|nr:hypothetical protein D9619_010558 [Psilocybe cf. subviscida]